MQPHTAKHAARRRAVVIVQVAVIASLLLGFGALTIDLGRLYMVKCELQAAADAGALAAAAMLAGGEEGDVEALARAAAAEYVGKHVVATEVAPLDPARDVELGRAELDPGTGHYEFTPTADGFDAVRVTVRRTANSGAGGIPLLFAHIFGYSSKDMWARGAAVLIPRDIAVVIDLSGSMNDDSELRHYKEFLGEEGDWRDGIDVNLHDIWCALDGPAPSRPYIPAPEGETEYADDVGPTVGAMTDWGSPVVCETYNPTSDPGLWLIKKGQTTTSAAAIASLTARGYTADEQAILLSGSRDSYVNQWRNRTAVILDLATWRSGRTGGTPGGDGDVYVESTAGEFAWAAYPPYRVNWTWADFIGYVGGTSEMTTTNSNLRYRYGLKTFVNFLLESKPRFSQTNVLWQTPEQPLNAVRDAVQAMTDVIVSLDSLDYTSLEVFAETARHEVDLSENLQAVPNCLYQRQAAHYDNYTNMGGGLLTAINELSSPRARSSSHKVIVLMSDGKPNIDEFGTCIGEGAASVNQWVKDLAQQAADENMQIFTISVGQDADQVLMTEIASIGRGQHFHAEGTPEEYADQLDLIFRKLGGKRPVALFE